MDLPRRLILFVCEIGKIDRDCAIDAVFRPWMVVLWFLAITVMPIGTLTASIRLFLVRLLPLGNGCVHCIRVR